LREGCEAPTRGEGAKKAVSENLSIGIVNTHVSEVAKKAAVVRTKVILKIERRKTSLPIGDDDVNVIMAPFQYSV